MLLCGCTLSRIVGRNRSRRARRSDAKTRTISVVVGLIWVNVIRIWGLCLKGVSGCVVFLGVSISVLVF